MRTCAHISCDDYPCLAEGTKKVGTKWFCEDHEEEASELYADAEADAWINEAEARYS